MRTRAAFVAVLLVLLAGLTLLASAARGGGKAAKQAGAKDPAQLLISKFLPAPVCDSLCVTPPFVRTPPPRRLFGLVCLLFYRT